MSVRILVGDCRSTLASLADGSVQCCVTSPPYFGLRDYGHAGQIGLEQTPDAYVTELVAVFREVKRVLRDDGTLWINLGDSYVSVGGAGTQGADGEMATRRVAQVRDSKAVHGTVSRPPSVAGLAPKNLLGIPWRVAFALQADGWYLRSDIIWAKPNPMPESVTDRPTKSHEYLFLLAKSERYYYDADAIAEPSGEWNAAKSSFHFDAETSDQKKAQMVRDGLQTQGGMTHADVDRNTRNKRTVWTVATQPFKGAHFATFPPALIEPCILAGCPRECCTVCGAPVERIVDRTPAEVRSPASDYGNGAGRNDGGRSQLVGARSETMGWAPTCECAAGVVPGTVLDPFGGAGTTGLVADRLGRDAILCELNPEYAKMAEARIRDESPMFAEVSIE